MSHYQSTGSKVPLNFLIAWRYIYCIFIPYFELWRVTTSKEIRYKTFKQWGSWSLTVLIKLFIIFPVPPRITQLLANKSIYYVDDQIICVTSGNPTPLVTWTTLNTSAVGNTAIVGSILTIRSDMAGFNIWICTASNNLGFDIQQISFNGERLCVLRLYE